jgi:hypothetical protein
MLQDYNSWKKSNVVGKRDRKRRLKLRGKLGLGRAGIAGGMFLG